MDEDSLQLSEDSSELNGEEALSLSMDQLFRDSIKRPMFKVKIPFQARRTSTKSATCRLRQSDPMLRVWIWTTTMRIYRKIQSPMKIRVTLSRLLGTISQCGQVPILNSLERCRRLYTTVIKKSWLQTTTKTGRGSRPGPWSTRILTYSSMTRSYCLLSSLHPRNRLKRALVRQNTSTRVFVLMEAHI